MLKKLYAISFIFIFLVGMIQPALPLIEYYIFQANIIDLFCVNKDKPEMNCDGVCYLKGQIEKKQISEKSNTNSLLSLEKLLLLHISIEEPSNFIKTNRKVYFSFNYSLKSLIISDLFRPPEY